MCVITQHKKLLGISKRNFNPIDLVMAVSRRDFVDTVEFLKQLIDSSPEVVGDGQRV
jgi:hypothetical protein